MTAYFFQFLQPVFSLCPPEGRVALRCSGFALIPFIFILDTTTTTTHNNNDNNNNHNDPTGRYVLAESVIRQLH